MPQFKKIGLHAELPTIRSAHMGKGENKRKEVKKKPLKTMAEKRTEKRAKKQA